MEYLGLGARTGSSHWLERAQHSHLPASSPPVSPATPRHPPFARLALLSIPAHTHAPHGPQKPHWPLLYACLPISRLLWHPFLLFILPDWRPTLAAPQCAPHPVQQILRKARPTLAQLQPP